MQRTTQERIKETQDALEELLHIFGGRELSFPMMDNGGHPMLWLDIDLVPHKKYMPLDELADIYPPAEGQSPEAYSQWLSNEQRQRREHNTRVVFRACKEDRISVEEAMALEFQKTEDGPPEKVLENLTPEILQALKDAEAEQKLVLYHVGPNPERRKRWPVGGWKLHHIRSFLNREKLNAGSTVAPEKTRGQRDWPFFFTVTGVAGNRNRLFELHAFLLGYRSKGTLYVFIIELYPLDLLRGSYAEYMKLLYNAQALDFAEQAASPAEPANEKPEDTKIELDGAYPPDDGVMPEGEPEKESAEPPEEIEEPAKTPRNDRGIATLGEVAAHNQAEHSANS